MKMIDVGPVEEKFEKNIILSRYNNNMLLACHKVLFEEKKINWGQNFAKRLFEQSLYPLFLFPHYLSRKYECCCKRCINPIKEIIKEKWVDEHNNLMHAFDAILLWSSIKTEMDGRLRKIVVKFIEKAIEIPEENTESEWMRFFRMLQFIDMRQNSYHLLLLSIKKN
jgi:hypothetical protein